MNAVEHVLSVGNMLGEGPLWNAEEQALYWVDFIENKHVHRYYPETGKHDVFALEIPIYVLGIKDSGGFVTASGKGFAHLNVEKQEFEFITNPIVDKPHLRFNDGAVDRQGRFWAGTMRIDNADIPEGTLYCLDPSGRVTVKEEDITVSNGIGWSPDNSRMYYTDTLRHVIYQYDFDPSSEEVRNQRPFVLTTLEDGLPDGLTVDSEGFVWSAFWGGWKVIRYNPEGGVDWVIKMPVENPTSCTFGGENLDELFITTAKNGLDEKQRRGQPLAGDLFRVKTGIKGIGETKFAD